MFEMFLLMLEVHLHQLLFLILGESLVIRISYILQIIIIFGNTIDHLVMLIFMLAQDHMAYKVIMDQRILHKLIKQVVFG